MKPNYKNRTVYHGDGLHFLRSLDSKTIDLVATDPPFNKGKEFKSKAGEFSDKWSWKDDAQDDWKELIKKHWPDVWDLLMYSKSASGESTAAYLCFMAVRLIAMCRVLKPTGNIVLHCDPTASHYLKLLMDGIFGARNFRNEIIWCYSGRGLSKSGFNKKHDVLLWYGRTTDSWFDADAAKRPVADEHQKRYNKIDKKGRRYAEIKNKDGSYSKIRLKDVVMADWWTMPYARGKESTGYPTQKPLALYRRLVKTLSKPGGFVLDPFCGSGTTLMAAELEGRKWLGSDLSRDGFNVTLDRFYESGLMNTLFWDKKLTVLETMWLLRRER